MFLIYLVLQLVRVIETEKIKTCKKEEQDISKKYYFLLFM